MEFISPKKSENPLDKISQVKEDITIHSRTNMPLPMFITTHDNWNGDGWQYKKKWGKTQQEMVKILIHDCKLSKEETRRFLRCNSTSVRGRLSEINSEITLKV